MNRAISILFVIFLVAGKSYTVHACLEVPKEPRSIYNNDVVFLGEVVSIRENWWKPHPTNPDYNPGILVKYKVLKPYHGVPYSQDFLQINVGDDREHGFFEKGEIGLVVANFWDEQKVLKMDSTKIHWSSCSGEGYYQNEKAIQEAEKRFQENLFQQLSREHPNWVLIFPVVLLFVLIPLWARQRRKLRSQLLEE